MSEEEDVSGKAKEKKTEKKSDLGEFSAKESFNNFFFNPQGGPIMENWIIVFLLSGALTYYMSSGNTSEEINYQLFINNYLAKN